MYRELDISTQRGPVTVREYGPRGADAAVLMVGGVGGGFDSPAKDLYGRLGEELPTEGISALRVRYRDPHQLAVCVSDVLAGLHHLHVHATERVILIGHSLGGAVVVNAALSSVNAVGVICLSTQTGGMEDPGRLHRPVLYVHGTDDDVLPAACSVSAWRMSRDPRRLELMDGAGHTLDDAADEVFTLVHRFILEDLRRDAAAAVSGK